MCEIPLYIDQYKSMASLDYASISDNLTRELLVIMIEMPEARGAIMSLRDAAKCANEAVEDAQEEGEGEDAEA